MYLTTKCYVYWTLWQDSGALLDRSEERKCTLVTNEMQLTFKVCVDDNANFEMLKRHDSGCLNKQLL